MSALDRFIMGAWLALILGVLVLILCELRAVRSARGEGDG